MASMVGDPAVYCFLVAAALLNTTWRLIFHVPNVLSFPVTDFKFRFLVSSNLTTIKASVHPHNNSALSATIDEVLLPQRKCQQ
jgi:hypothetical protein